MVEAFKPDLTIAASVVEAIPLLTPAASVPMPTSYLFAPAIVSQLRVTVVAVADSCVGFVGRAGGVVSDTAADKAVCVLSTFLAFTLKL